MSGFEAYNPAVVGTYFLAVSGIAVFSADPAVILLSLAASVSVFASGRCGGGARQHVYMLALFAVMAAVNPIVSHNGVTVLFVLNNNPVTLEAVLYGVFTSAMVISVVYWFKYFSKIMTGDRLLYIFGGISPKLALLFSMAMRYVPLFSRQASAVSRSQRALGLYEDDNLIDRVKGGVRVFSVMVTWSLENGIITADSMSARGYGTGRRTNFSDITFGKKDGLLLFTVLLLAAVSAWGIGGAGFGFYPAVSAYPLNFRTVTGLATYAAVAFLPTAINIKEDIKWKYLRSRI